jgi:hypothetical protein
MDIDATRRGFLISVGCGVGVIAGCSGNTSSGEAQIREIQFQNLDDAAHTIEMELEESDEVVLSDRAELQPAEYREGELTAATVRVVSGIPKEPGVYVLQARMDGMTRTFRTADWPDTDCFSQLELKADRDGNLGIWNSTGCPEETPTGT